MIGLTIVNAKRILNGADPIVISVPELVVIDPAALAPAVS